MFAFGLAVVAVAVRFLLIVPKVRRSREGGGKSTGRVNSNLVELE